MNTSLLNIIRRIVNQEGESILTNPQRLKPLFADYAKNEAKEDRIAFGRAIENGFYMELKRVPPEDRNRVKTALVPRLQIMTGFDTRRCVETIDLLEAVMFTPAQSSQPQQPRHVPTNATYHAPLTYPNQYQQPQQVLPGQTSQGIMADEKYCFSCGSVIKKMAQVCPKCGVKVGVEPPQSCMLCSRCGTQLPFGSPFCNRCGQSLGMPGSAPGTAIAGLVLGIISVVGAWVLWGIVPIIGIILSGVGMSKAKRENLQAGTAVAGLVLSIIGLVASLILFTSMLLFW